MTAAFGAVYNSDTDNPPFEIIGFDACLTATYNAVDAAVIYKVHGENRNQCGGICFGERTYNFLTVDKLSTARTFGRLFFCGNIRTAPIGRNVTFPVDFFRRLS